MKRTAAALSISIGLVACGGGGGGSSEKDLFSLWTDTDTNAPLDLRGGAFSTPLPMHSYYPDGAQCDCTLTVLGTQSGGTYIINACVYRYGTGSGDPGCNSLDGTGTYTKTSDTLTTYPSSGSPSTYK